MPIKAVHTDNLVPLQFLVHQSSVAQIIRYVERVEKPHSVPWRDQLAGKHGSIPASVLRGARGKADMTQNRLSELTGISQPYISEMERGMRPIGKGVANKLAAALGSTTMEKLANKLEERESR